MGKRERYDKWAMQKIKVREKMTQKGDRKEDGNYTDREENIRCWGTERWVRIEIKRKTEQRKRKRKN